MKYLLARDNRRMLEQYAWSRVLLAFDFDGTLSPIVSDPGAARMRPSTHALFRQVAQRYPCAVISGRSRSDLERRLGEVKVKATVGNHGIEPARDMLRYAKLVERWLPVLREQLREHPGLFLENKGYSLAVHYRKSRRKRLALEAIGGAVHALGDQVRVIGGKQVVNLVPQGAPHKGMALRNLRTRLEADTALYVGDDLTDEDVFALDEPGRLLGVRIGKTRVTHAAYYLRTQSEIDLLLERLLELRPAPEAHRREDP